MVLMIVCSWHEFLVINNNVNALMLWGSGTFLLAAHFGNIRGEP